MDEFEIINTFFRPLSEGNPSSLSLMDDAALLNTNSECQLVITKDVMTAGVHYFADDPAEFVARKSLRVNISDIVAMGATPATYLMALSLPNGIDHKWLQLFARGLQHDQDIYGIGLSGGDTVSTPGPLSISITMLGHIEVDKALQRSTAKPGDDIWVSGTIGDAGVALHIIKGNIHVDDLAARKYLIERFHLPEPRVALGSRLVGIAHSAIDISDGLAADLENVCNASGLGAIVQGNSIPLSNVLSRLIGKFDFLDISHIVSAGDDYELLFTAPPKHAKVIIELSKEIDLQITRIGTIVEGRTIRIIDVDGQDLEFEKKGFRHNFK